MATLKLKFFIRDLGIIRFWSAWTRKCITSSVVKRRIRDRGFREVIQVFKYAILRPRRTLFLSATAAYKSHNNDSFSCDQGISDDELQALLLELENVQNLTKMTLYCTGCGCRVVVDRKQDGVRYCMCKERQMDCDGADGWVPYMEADDVIIWRKEYKPGGLYAYKVYGRYPEISASDFAAVQLDGAYRRVWDSAVAALAVVQRDARGVPGQAVLHWEVLWPRLFANRDYVYLRRHKEYDITTNIPKIEEKTIKYDINVHAKAKRKSIESYKSSNKENDVNNKVYIIVSKSCEHPDVPETKHAIRVAEYWSHMVVKTIDGSEKAGMEFVLTYYDEPAAGGLPGGVAAWACGRAAPAYLAAMRAAAARYRAWRSARASRAASPQEVPDFIPFGPDQVNSEQILQIQEQDMESSKQGPDMENGITTRDQSSQTEEFLMQICSTDNKDTNKSSNEQQKDEVKERDKHSEEDRKDDDKKEKPSSDKKDATLEGDNDKSEEEENNGGWWRYLYPFYYFV